MQNTGSKGKHKYSYGRKEEAVLIAPYNQILQGLKPCFQEYPKAIFIWGLNSRVLSLINILITK